MSTNNKHKISEKELDNLLGQAFLNLDFTNPKNEELMETISNQVLPTQSVSSGLFNKAFFTKLMSVIILIATSTFIYFTYFKINHKNLIQNTNITSNAISNSEPTINPLKQETVLTNTNTIAEAKQKTSTAILTVPENQKPVFYEFPKHQVSGTIYIPEEKKVKSEDSNYVFPKLTEKEIKATEKQKEKMINWLLKQSKEKYALIAPKAAHSVFSSINDTAAIFYMQNTEVSNLEYRTFLFDLLINDKKAEFVIAKPHQYLWLNAPGNAKGNMMKDLYFSEKQFDTYPVVNISKEGAELYCQWLSSLSKKGYSNIIARLPYENEWINAAKGKDTKAVYPWPGDSIQNRYGCHLANFCIKKQSEKLRPNMKCVPKNANAYSSAEFMLGDSMMTCKVTSYNPNDYGLYCMVGNVAEMVYDNKTKIIKAKGGSWNSDFEQCKIVNSEGFNAATKANPMTGFRPIFRIAQTHSFGSIQRENSETGIATLTTEETAAALKEKKKIIDALIKLNKDKYAYIPMGSFLYKKDTFSVQSFYMETTEVTNLEYRTFLADLLIQNRTTDYLTAKPDQQMWITKFPYSYNEPMRDMYFWHPAYDEYPVVNISRKAAEMYCLWLTIQTNKVLKENNKPLMNDIRIPDEYEWAYAASNKKNYIKYANGNEFLRDSKGKYAVNYMCFSKEQCRYDSVMKLYVPKIEKRTKDEETHQAIIDDGAFHTTLTKSYQPNTYGLYCTAGNVSEMVINHKTNKPETKGGSWFSCDYYLQIDADDEYQNEINASPLIGFRPVFTALKK
jgi:formylglycine-generating enzyme required for sulfatase activity